MDETKVVLDTNFLVSSLLKPESKARQIYRLVLRGEIKLYTSKPLLSELERVLEYPKFKIERLQRQVFLKNLTRIGILIHPTQKIDLIKEDPPDNRFLECAVMAGVDYLISGDNKHLLPLKNFQEIKIIAPSTFWDIYQKK